MSSESQEIDGLPPSAKLVYKTLEYNGQMNQKDLSDESRLSPRTVRYAIDRLREKDLIYETPSLDDGRCSFYSLKRSMSSKGEYAKDVVVEADCLEDRLDEVHRESASVRLVEANFESGSYDDWHIPGAVELTWEKFQGPTRRGLLSKERFESLVGELGIRDDSTVILYGDSSNRFAAYVYWAFKYYGHDDVYLLDGGKRHWVEESYTVSSDDVSFETREYSSEGSFKNIRAYREEIRNAFNSETVILDVRNRDEFTGEEVPDDKAAVGGHIPDAINLPWHRNVEEDGRFKKREELEEVYSDKVSRSNRVIVYCNVGERSALSWFVLSELLGYSYVSNYDGSWTEWGNLVDAPVETGGGQR
ncbi:MAG: rhodanese-like domain-containing protein [Halobacteria archaeon]|nr:rhodanese-like domain-containing protein [Halobacteria archaeon]